MIRQRYGRIVNLSSQAGFVAQPGESVYCMTKAAVAHLTKCLAVEWGRTGLRSTWSRPRSSPRTKQQDLADPAFAADLLSDCGPRRIGEPWSGRRSGLPSLTGSLTHHRSHAIN